MGTNISMATAHRIWTAHREIEVGTKLLADLTQCISSGDDPTPIDAFGRRRNYQLGVPSGDNGHRLFDVSPKLAVYIIEAHIAEKRRELTDACIGARMELDGAIAIDTDGPGNPPPVTKG